MGFGYTLQLPSESVTVFFLRIFFRRRPKPSRARRRGSAHALASKRTCAATLCAHSPASRGCDGVMPWRDAHLALGPSARASRVPTLPDTMPRHTPHPTNASLSSTGLRGLVASRRTDSRRWCPSSLSSPCRCAASRTRTSTNWRTHGLLGTT